MGAGEAACLGVALALGVHLRAWRRTWCRGVFEQVAGYHEAMHPTRDVLSNCPGGTGDHLGVGGTHYDALADVVSADDGRLARGRIVSVASDGDCLYTAILVQGSFGWLAQLPGAKRIIVARRRRRAAQANAMRSERVQAAAVALAGSGEVLR